MKKKVIFSLLALLLSTNIGAQTYKLLTDITYTAKTDSYAQERLKLDVYYPERMTDSPVVVWFHGGGLEAGEKEIPEKLKEKGLVVVGVNYRLLPKVTIDKTLDGHSAGGYLAMMLCLNKAWLGRYNVDADSVMMYVPFSGQAITHYNVRKMQGIPPLQATIDEYAPLYWVRKDCPPLVLICGDRELELFGRYDENQYLARMMKLAGHTETYLYELGGHDHGQMVEPAFLILETHLKKVLKKK